MSSAAANSAPPAPPEPAADQSAGYLEMEPHSRIVSLPAATPRMTYGESAMGFVQIFLASPMPMSIVRLADGRFVDANDAFLDLFGFRRADLIGHRPSDVGVCGKQCFSPEHEAQLRSRGFLRNVQVAWFTKQRHLRQLSTTCQIIEVGGDPCVLIVQDDVTEQRAAQSALAASEARFRAVFNEARLGIVVIDSAGSILRYNLALARVLDVSQTELNGEPFNEQIHPDHQAELEALLRAVFDDRSQGSVPICVRASTNGERKVWLELQGSRVEEQGRPRGVLLIEDVTERKQMQMQLEVADRLASLGTLAAGVAHEINNPLAYITANLDYVLEELARISSGVDPEVLHELIEATEEAKAGAERVRGIVQDLKTFSREKQDHTGSVALASVLKSALNMTHNEVKHRATLVVDVPQGLFVEGNESRLAQVFINLLVNAAQALPARPLAENRILITAEERGSEVELLIEDNGCGIPAEAIGRVFDPFFTTKPVGVGTGLGLSICHNIIKGAGGDISVESEPEQYTRFRLRLRKA
ncbi:MAG: PAS domain S-box protein [Polyangiaceae bacterium]|nr:PAS domain S-box protein [Polyangiaceae bacterium]